MHSYNVVPVLSLYLAQPIRDGIPLLVYSMQPYLPLGMAGMAKGGVSSIILNIRNRWRL